jgi:hypothetical protein
MPYALEDLLRSELVDRKFKSDIPASIGLRSNPESEGHQLKTIPPNLFGPLSTLTPPTAESVQLVGSRRFNNV